MLQISFIIAVCLVNYTFALRCPRTPTTIAQTLGITTRVKRLKLTTATPFDSWIDIPESDITPVGRIAVDCIQQELDARANGTDIAFISTIGVPHANSTSLLQTALDSAVVTSFLSKRNATIHSLTDDRHQSPLVAIEESIANGKTPLTILFYNDIVTTEMIGETARMMRKWPSNIVSIVSTSQDVSPFPLREFPFPTAPAYGNAVSKALILKLLPPRFLISKVNNILSNLGAIVVYSWSGLINLCDNDIIEYLKILQMETFWKTRQIWSFLRSLSKILHTDLFSLQDSVSMAETLETIFGKVHVDPLANTTINSIKKYHAILCPTPNNGYGLTMTVPHLMQLINEVTAALPMNVVHSLPSILRLIRTSFFDVAKNNKEQVGDITEANVVLAIGSAKGSTTKERFGMSFLLHDSLPLNFHNASLVTDMDDLHTFLCCKSGLIKTHKNCPGSDCIVNLNCDTIFFSIKSDATNQTNALNMGLSIVFSILMTMESKFYEETQLFYKSKIATNAMIGGLKNIYVGFYLWDPHAKKESISDIKTAINDHNEQILLTCTANAQHRPLHEHIKLLLQPGGLFDIYMKEFFETNVDVMTKEGMSNWLSDVQSKFMQALNPFRTQWFSKKQNRLK